jgi:hypothetical protein
LIFGVAVISQSAAAQYPKTHPTLPGSLDGSVKGTKGAPVSGAEIIWQAADGGVPHILHSDRDGHFAVPRLRVGLYDLRASKGQVQSNWTHNVLIRAGEATVVTLRLETSKSIPQPQSK